MIINLFIATIQNGYDSFDRLENIKKSHIAYNTIDINNRYHNILYITDNIMCMHNSIISLFERFDTRCGYHRCHRSSVVK